VTPSAGTIPQNDRYVAAALCWLRARLEKLPEEEREAAAAMAEAEAACEMPPPFLRLARIFRLTRFEQNILLLCIGMELDTRIPDLCARAQDNPDRGYATFGLALTIFDEPSWDALSAGGGLRYWDLVEAMPAGVEPLVAAPLRTDERIVGYVKGVNAPDARLATLMSVRGPQVEELAPSQHRFVDEIVGRLLHAGDPKPLVQLLGTDPESKAAVAEAAAAAFGCQLCAVSAEALAAHSAELDRWAKIWRREQALSRLALYIEAHDLDQASANATWPVRRLAANCPGILFVSARESCESIARSSISFEIAKPSQREQEAAWAAVLHDDGLSAALACEFRLGLRTIREIADFALACDSTGEDSLPNRLWSACRSATRLRLDLLAQPLDLKAGWKDLVLPPEQSETLRQIADQVRNRGIVYRQWGFAERLKRGTGISALFAGDSGTGKTMAAEAIAKELGLNLYRIDLAAVVSKYIGETEKNLRKIFDAADEGGAILLFDEADALFGKRGEVRDSHDRYANIEVSYLLQRMEAFHGLAILTTNIKSAIDGAFLRRLRFVVNFPFPGAAERKRIWQQVFPPETPVGHLDFDRLDRFNLTGGAIHNAALNAVFLAARAGSSVTMPMVLAAVRAEMVKLDRPVDESDFSWRQATGAVA